MAVLIFGLTACNENNEPVLSESSSQIIDSASTVVSQEIDKLLSNTLKATEDVSSHHEIINAIASDNRDELLRVANKVKQVANLDFITIADNSGIVLVRTLNPLSHGDNIAQFPHIKNALNGNTMSYIETGISVRLTTSACAPIYDDNMYLIGVVHLGYRLDEQQFVIRMKELTGCEISIFTYDERIATTIMDEDGLFVLGTRAAEEVIDRVFAGETHTEKTFIFGSEAFVRYDPIFSADNQVIGMISIAAFAQ